MTRAAAARVDAILKGEVPEEILLIREIVDLRTSVANQLNDAVAHARSRGASWEDIAEAVGISRQSAWSRWRDR